MFQHIQQTSSSYTQTSINIPPPVSVKLNTGNPHSQNFTWTSAVLTPTQPLLIYNTYYVHLHRCRLWGNYILSQETRLLWRSGQRNFSVPEQERPICRELIKDRQLPFIHIHLLVAVCHAYTSICAYHTHWHHYFLFCLSRWPAKIMLSI